MNDKELNCKHCYCQRAEVSPKPFLQSYPTIPHKQCCNCGNKQAINQNLNDVMKQIY